MVGAEGLSVGAQILRQQKMLVGGSVERAHAQVLAPIVAFSKCMQNRSMPVACE